MIKFYEEYQKFEATDPRFPNAVFPTGKATLRKIGGKKSLLKFLRSLKGPYTFRKSYSECGKKHGVEVWGDFGRLAVIVW